MDVRSLVLDVSKAKEDVGECGFNFDMVSIPSNSKSEGDRPNTWRDDDSEAEWDSEDAGYTWADEEELVSRKWASRHAEKWVSRIFST